ncbi:hypothetical protein [Candidatus Palauibacter sp.]|uniref:hypothetical protein n=1 Tax=Candidatus Palauibacter sp. TaxID=3101350 RepID=UPI003B5249A5
MKKHVIPLRSRHLAGGIILSALLLSAHPVIAATEATATCRQAMQRLRPAISSLETEGHVRFTDAKIYVSEVLWRLMDAEQKEGLTSNLVIYQECRKTPSRTTIIGTGAVYGKQSGVRLARITLFGGFKIG